MLFGVDVVFDTNQLVATGKSDMVTAIALAAICLTRPIDRWIREKPLQATDAVRVE